MLRERDHPQPVPGSGGPPGDPGRAPDGAASPRPRTGRPTCTGRWSRAVRSDAGGGGHRPDGRPGDSASSATTSSCTPAVSTTTDARSQALLRAAPSGPTTWSRRGHLRALRGRMAGSYRRACSREVLGPLCGGGPRGHRPEQRRGLPRSRHRRYARAGPGGPGERRHRPRHVDAVLRAATGRGPRGAQEWAGARANHGRGPGRRRQPRGGGRPRGEVPRTRGTGGRSRRRRPHRRTIERLDTLADVRELPSPWPRRCRPSRPRRPTAECARWPADGCRLPTAFSESTHRSAARTKLSAGGCSGAGSRRAHWSKPFGSWRG